jgi:hypothetical protein
MDSGWCEENVRGVRRGYTEDMVEGNSDIELTVLSAKPMRRGKDNAEDMAAGRAEDVPLSQYTASADVRRASP